MLLKDISVLGPTGRQAVIINVSTKWVTTLALLSVNRYAQMPILVIDCESKDGSLEHFIRLMKVYDFDLLSAPLKKHGETLDWLFDKILAEKVLLVDSDAEILSPDVLQMMETYIGEDKVFGCGFVHAPCWFPNHYAVGYYQERMWLPLTMLKVSYVREALNAGHSFADKTVLNDFPASEFVSRLLELRFRYPSMRGWRLPWLNWLKESYYGHKPSYVYYDTGADVYQFLKYQRGLHFVGLPHELHERYVAHYHGVTRSLLNPLDDNCTRHGDVIDRVRGRLEQVYGIKE